MQPTIGRSVHFHPTAQVTWAAIITDVHPSGKVDLSIFAPGRPLMHRQEAEMGLLQGQWTWPILVAPEAPADEPEQEGSASE